MITIRLAKTQRPDTAEIIDRKQVVELIERRKARVIFPALRMVSRDHPPTPGIRRRIRERPMKEGIVLGGGLVELMARRKLQIGRDVEPLCGRKPGISVGDGAVLAPALSRVVE
jgi:hypothetical protein